MPYIETMRKRRSGRLVLTGKGQITLPFDSRPAALKLDILNDIGALPSCAPAAKNSVTGDIAEFSVVILWDVESECDVNWTVTRFKD